MYAQLSSFTITVNEYGCGRASAAVGVQQKVPVGNWSLVAVNVAPGIALFQFNETVWSVLASAV